MPEIIALTILSIGIVCLIKEMVLSFKNTGEESSQREITPKEN